MAPRADPAEQDRWVKAALRGPVVNPRPSKSWYSTILSAFSSFPGYRTPVGRLFDRVRDKKIIIVGLDGVGKTKLLRDHICLEREGRDIAIRKPTLWVGVESVAYPHNVLFMTLCVGGGRPSGCIMFERKIQQLGDAIVFVVDACDPDRAAEAREELLHIIRRRERIENVWYSKRVLDGVPILVLATQQNHSRTQNTRITDGVPNQAADHTEPMSLEEVKRLFERSVHDGDDIPSLMNEQPWAIMSGESEKDVHKAFQWLVNEIEQRGAPEMVEVKGTSSEKI